MKKLCCIFTILVSLGVSAGEIYTCTVNGKTVYQGKPCVGSKELRDKVYTAKAKEKAREQAYKQQQAEWAARVEPRVGMSSQQAENSTWGYPSDVNKTVNAYGVNEQWVYRGLGYSKGRYLYFKNGILTSIQE
ncbi:hypothetical protein [Acinetobacter sp. YH12085]|uniref:hypothetical protein n=1 Tax=Acinetobacter sp. YH12085 TaxID=2601077 RepID=UPI0015D4024E